MSLKSDSNPRLEERGEKIYNESYSPRASCKIPTKFGVGRVATYRKALGRVYLHRGILLTSRRSDEDTVERSGNDRTESFARIELLP